MTNAYKSASSHFKDLTVKVNQTYVFIENKNVYINGEVRSVLPFKNDQITIKRETTVFIVITGNNFIKKSSIHSFFYILNFRSWFSNSIRWYSSLYSFRSIIC
jgi:hypothetical protein